MNQLNKQAVGLTVGIVVAGTHLVWAALVFLGLAQGFLDWVSWLHFFQNPVIVMAFGWKRAAGLIGVTFMVGYIVGWVSTTVWNKMMRRS